VLQSPVEEKEKPGRRNKEWVDNILEWTGTVYALTKKDGESYHPYKLQFWDEDEEISAMINSM